MIFLSSRLQPLRRSGRQTILNFYPQDLTTIEIIQVILIFVARQLLSLIGIGTTFDIQNSSDDRNEYVLPELRLSMPLCITDSRIQAYALAVGQADPKQILQRPEQLCLMLATFSQPAFLLLLAHHQSPIRPIGAVNVRNKFELLRPDLCLDVSDEKLNGHGGKEARARFVPETRKVKRGLELDLEVEIVDLEHDVVVFRQVFTTLQFMKVKAGKTEKQAADIVSTEAEGLDGSSRTFSIPRDFTIKWARICKDYNPIHTSRLVAKVLGLPGRILHGNHALAWAMQLTQDQIGLQQKQKITVEVQFRRPMVVPAKLVAEVAKLSDKGQSALRIRSESGRIYVTSSIVVA